MKSKTPPITKKDHDTYSCQIQADTFHLYAEVCDNSLNITLSDYVLWKIYQSKYILENIGKQISPIFQLEDIYFALGGTFQIEKNPQKHQILHYRFGQAIQKNNFSHLIIDRNGRISIFNKISIQKPNPFIKCRKIVQTRLQLKEIYKIQQLQKYQIIKNITRKQIQQKYKQQVTELKTQLQKMRQNTKQAFREKLKQQEQLKQTERITISVRKKIEQNNKNLIKSLSQGIPDILDLTVKCSQNCLVSRIKQYVSTKINISSDRYSLTFNGYNLDEKNSLKELKITNNSILMINFQKKLD